MSTTIHNIISQLEQIKAPNVAYFSFDADENGDGGVIHANKEGLQLYALEMLKKALEMEEKPDGGRLYFFEPQEWLVSDTPYDLISAVKPDPRPRQVILADRYNLPQLSPQTDESLQLTVHPRRKRFFGIF